jgi:hypothetical protein
MAYSPEQLLHIGTVLAALATVVITGCTEVTATPRFELRWCSNGQASCVLNQKEGSYVRGGFFSSLDRCNDAIRHLSFYGNKVGGACVEIADWERKKLDGGT